MAATLFRSLLRSARLHPAYGALYPLMTPPRSIHELGICPQTAWIVLSGTLILQPGTAMIKVNTFFSTGVSTLFFFRMRD